MAGVDYSSLAGAYQWLERCVFGSRLQRARVALIDALLDQVTELGSQRLLVVGDGDGRFLKALLAASREVRVDYVDVSAGMLEVARKRVGETSQVSWHCCDVRDWSDVDYAGVVAHFVLDGFEGGELDRLVEHLVGKLSQGGVLLVSDFDPQARFWAPSFVRVMQWFFALFARLPVVQVRRSCAEFERFGGQKLASRLWQRGWIYTELWKF